MLVVKLVGGLASQLHKYAVALSISREIGCELKVDCTYFDKKRYDFNPIMRYGLPDLGFFPSVATAEDVCAAKGYGYFLTMLYKFFYSALLNKITYGYSGRIFGLIERKLFPSIRLEKNSFRVHVTSYNSAWKDELVRSYNGNMFLEGEFGMDFSTLDSLRTELKSQISKCKLSMHANKALCLMEKSNKSVAIHVRRGDYVNNKSVNEFHGTCGLNYYRNCILELDSQHNDLVYFIFSDDMDWVRCEFGKFMNNVHYFVEGNMAHEDFSLMTRCGYHVVANSGFSSFAAWLSMAPCKNIYSPARWFLEEKTNRNQMEMLPKSWNYR